MDEYQSPAFQPIQPRPRSGSRRVAVWILSILTAIFFLTSLLLFAVVAVVLLGAAATSAVRDGDYKERVLMGEGPDKVLLLQVTGPIADYQSFGIFGATEDTVESVRRQLDRAAEDSAVKAVLLEINSPGGGMTASDTVHHLLLKFKRETGKPVVAHFTDIAASGGYYVATAADTIIAHPATLTGSIGALFVLINIEGLYEKIGVKDVTIKSVPLKDIGSPSRQMTDEERRILQAIIDRMHERFIQIIADGRPDLSLERVRKIADGRIFTGEEAKDLGLVDALGYREDGFDRAKELAGIPLARLVRYERVVSLMRLITGYSQMGKQLPLDFRLTEPKEMILPMYLWRPNL